MLQENEINRNLSYLLKEINIIRERYLHNEAEKEAFNVFTTLLNADDEVCLHSRFISSLLDPKGPHGFGIEPLSLFLDAISSDFICSENVEVIPNNETWSEHKEIDILIRDKSSKSCVIIENKIYAKDSNHSNRGQIEGYYQNQLSEGYNADKIEVYYLTTDRHEPTLESVCTNNKTPELAEKIRCIDYTHEISTWLINLASKAYSKPYLRETVSQYLNLIKEMTGDINIQERKDIIALIGKNEDNLYSAKLLLDNYRHICWHTLYDFCNDMKAALEDKDYLIESIPEEDDITTIIHGGPNQRKKVSISFVFKDKYGISWTLSSEAEDEYGFWIGLEKAKNKSIQKELKDAIKLYSSDKDSNEGWYYWKYIKDLKGPLLYFWDFLLQDSITFDLISPQKREKVIGIISSLVSSEIKAFAKTI